MALASARLSRIRHIRRQEGSYSSNQLTLGKGEDHQHIISMSDAESPLAFVMIEAPEM